MTLRRREREWRRRRFRRVILSRRLEASYETGCGKLQTRNTCDRGSDWRHIPRRPGFDQLPPRSCDPLLASLADRLQDRYAFERLRGKGGMATVYLAPGPQARPAVALKVLSPELAR